MKPYKNIQLNGNLIEWEDANGYQSLELSEHYWYKVWDIELFNYAIHLGYGKSAEHFADDVTDKLGRSVVMSQCAVIKLLEAAKNGDAIDYECLRDYFPRVEEQDIFEIVEKMKTEDIYAYDAFDELVMSNER